VRPHLPLLVAAALAALSAEVRADESSERIDFRADRAQADLSTGTVELQGDVRARCGRYQMHADRLLIETFPGRVDVTGPATVTLCPCADSPVSFSFEHASVRPPSDLWLTSPRLKVAGATVFWLPAAWLRTPDEPGFLPPRLAWRGSDGLLAGAGAHLPWSGQDARTSALDVYVSGYAKGGLEVDSRLQTAQSSTRLRFDHLRSDLVQLESRGAAGQGSATLSWAADLARGARAPRGLIELEPAARRWDQARAQVAVLPIGSVRLATGLEVWGDRSLQRPMSFGPAAHASGGGAIASIGSWDASASSQLLSEPDAGAAQLSRAVAGGELDGRLGPLSAAWLARSSAASVAIDRDRASDLAVGTVLRVSMPLGRAFGDERHPLLHVLEPFLQGAAIASRTSSIAWLASDRPEALSSGQHWIGSAGLRTAVGRAGAPWGAELKASAGPFGPFDNVTPSPAAVGELSAHAPWASLQAQGAGVHYDVSTRGVLIARARIGPATTAHARLRLAYRSDLEASAARALTWGDPYGAGTGWLDRKGTSAGLDAVVPVGAGYKLFASGDTDPSQRELIAARGGVLYAHRCGCLAASAWAGHRLGREGIDAWLALDLAP
jgi:hypothetical protein